MRRTVVHYTDSTVFGGAEQMLFTLLAALDRRRWRPVLIHHDARGATPIGERARALDVEVRCLPRPRRTLLVRELHTFARAIRAERASVFHAHLGWPLRCSRALLGARLARVPAVVATQQLFSGAWVRRYESAGRHRLVSTAVDRYIAVSRAIADEMQPFCVRRDRQVTVVYNAVDPARITTPASARAHEACGGRPTILTLARLEEQKGLEHLVAAAALVPEATFVVAGEGRERASLEARAREAGVADRVRFVGHRSDVPELLAACDLFVLPSLVEGSPISVMEAMAAGRPVVATDIGGTNEVVLDGATGLLVPPADPEALAMAIRAVLGDAELRDRLGAAGRERARREFSAEAMAAQVSTVYEELLEVVGDAASRERPAATAAHAAPREAQSELSAPVSARRGGCANLPEERRNARLRRADWRFLLPQPRVERAVCFAHGALADAARTFADRVWQAAGASPSDLPADGTCELAVAADPDDRVLRAAARALEDGGACYTEWRGSRWQSPARVRARLHAAGFERAACYAVRPGPDEAQPLVWASLDTRAAATDFLARLPQARTRRSRLRRRLRHALWLVAPALRTAPFICAVARKRGAVGRGESPRRAGTQRRDEGRPDSLRETIRSEWSAWGLGDTPPRLGWTLLTGGRRSINKVVALAFSDRDTVPRVALKIARVPESHASLRNEACALEALRRVRPDGLAGVPRLLLCRADADTVVVAETALRGRPLATLLRDQPDALAARATDWLLQLVVEGDGRRAADRRRRIVDPVVAEFEASFGSVVDRAMLRDAVASLATLGELDALPVTHEQRDFAPWNLLVGDDGGLVVLDWESSEPLGLPLLDLVYFLAHFAFDLARAYDLRSRREAHRAVLDPATRMGALAHACVGWYGQRVALPAEAVRPLRLLTWMLHSRSEYRQLCAETARGGVPDAEALRRSLFLALWEDEMRHGRES